MSRALLLRELDRAATSSWSGVLSYCTGEDDGDAQLIRAIKKIIRRRRTPALFHNGRKPR